MVVSFYSVRGDSLRGVPPYGAFSSFDWPVEYFFGGIPVGQRTLRDGSSGIAQDRGNHLGIEIHIGRYLALQRARAS